MLEYMMSSMHKVKVSLYYSTKADVFDRLGNSTIDQSTLINVRPKILLKNAQTLYRNRCLKQAHYLSDSQYFTRRLIRSTTLYYR